MNTRVVVTALLSLLFLPFKIAAEQQQEIKLWAAVSVFVPDIPSPVFHEGLTENLQVFFVVVNDGDSTVDPEIDSSHLFVNGVEPQDWRMVTMNGLRGGNYNALKPGEYTGFGPLLGKYFEKPGIYTLRWEGKHFKATEVTFRVLPGRVPRVPAGPRPTGSAK